MEIEKLLPIGSIVRLKDSEKRLMVFGIKQSGSAGGGEVTADYIGVLYPEGYMGEQYQYLFNHGKIDEVVYRGFEDGERDTFTRKLGEIFAKRQEA
ncbi:MAG: DUF4176 domain-containing protein [Peptococcaceae bacterium]|jgi:hypothetical protein|nr:DUF4176 domain-containing protein [Peptococcaceae bacterium]